MPYNIWGALVAKRLSSLPRTPIVGPLADDNTVVSELINAAIEIVDKDPDRFLQIITYNPDLPYGSLCKFIWKSEYITEIPTYPQEIRFVNSIFNASHYLLILDELKERFTTLEILKQKPIFLFVGQK